MNRLIVIVMVGCSANTASVASGLAVLPESYNAHPNDGLDDRLGIQAAIDQACVTGGTVQLGEGRWDLTSAPPGSYNHYAALTLKCRGVDIVGSGRHDTTLRLTGDMGGGATMVLQLLPGASDNRIAHFTIDTSGTSNEDEQSRALMIGGNTCVGALCNQDIENILVENLDIIHPAPQDSTRKGDCIGVFGEANHVVRNVKLLDLNLLECARSGIAGQRYADFLTVSRVFFDGDHTGGTMFDGEATGGGWQRGLVFTGNTMRRTLPGGDSYGVALTSQTQFVVCDNLFIGRGINVYRGINGSICNNVFDTSDVEASIAVLELGNVIERVAIVGNSIYRRGGAGSMIKIRPAQGSFATAVTVANNVGTTDTDGAAIFVDAAQVLTVTGNAITGRGTGILITGGGRESRAVSITGNALSGFEFAGVRLDPGPFALTGVVVNANTVVNSGPWLRCDDPPMWTPGSLSVGVNSYPTSSPMICQ